ncbi:type II toxin-antitoxin system PemK/MazF family toxin [Salisediminibacterium selenitireducens]|uniref:Transcriptional modulator of MazE/toxin, MazF n=1 Tax=Bacillus selenitireducens (strain ATCC 700615 / DSM 15326 / MLS10) TaxID=439292 RepID=D6XXU1_BACIE|nr:type II toxin-antitoxin system PemK/MazF family toxin [Salisediminibacterium selenitireducens]ADI00134.1 transcriptional modulator of MazE/toxin, MazF [[Bacillus] selenitireducens MLS10]
MSEVADRGNLVYLNFNPQAGHEQTGSRSAIVISPESFNRITGFAVVCPITSVSKDYPFEVALPDGLAIHGVILTDQIKSLDWKARKLNVVDEAPAETVQECLEKIHTFIT